MGDWCPIEETNVSHWNVHWSAQGRTISYDVDSYISGLKLSKQKCDIKMTSYLGFLLEPVSPHVIAGNSALSFSQ